MPIRLIILSFILLAAGILHLLKPETFYPLLPDILIHKKELTVFTGYLEIILAFGFFWPRSRDLTAKMTALYFLLILPVHIYMAIFGIQMFGVSHPLILWFRVLFQFVFFFWALSLQTKSWIMQQVWEDVVFIHYKISPEKIQSLVPFPLDLYQGEAVLSIVPFKMSGIRFPFLPAVPGLSSLWELNLRTYVTVNGVRGVYFFSLDTDLWIGERVARSVFHLPYYYSKIKASVTNGVYAFDHERVPFAFNLKARLSSKPQTGAFNLWATERYHLFTQAGGKTYQGDVQHPPWNLVDVEIENFTDRLTDTIGLKNLGSPFATSYCSLLRVRFLPFRKLKT